MSFSTYTAGPALRDGLVDAATTAIDDPDVWIGLDGPTAAQFESYGAAGDYVGVGSVVSDIPSGGFGPTGAPMGPQRHANEALSVQVLIHVHRAGDDSVAQVVSDRAFELLQAVEHYLRMTDPTVAGVVQQCWRQHYEFYSDPWTSDTASGRVVELLVTFNAWQRISN